MSWNFTIEHVGMFVIGALLALCALWGFLWLSLGMLIGAGGTTVSGIIILAIAVAPLMVLMFVWFALPR